MKVWFNAIFAAGLCLSALSVHAQAPLSFSAATKQLGRIHSPAVIVTNQFRGEPRWWEKPGSDPLSEVKKENFDATYGFDPSPVDSKEIIVPGKPHQHSVEIPPAAEARHGDPELPFLSKGVSSSPLSRLYFPGAAVTAWSHGSLEPSHKLDFSPISAFRPAGHSDLSGDTESDSEDLSGVPSPDAGRVLLFAQADAAGGPTLRRGPESLDGDGAGPVAAISIRPVPHVITPEPNTLVLAGLFLGVWQVFLRRRRG